MKFNLKPAKSTLALVLSLMGSVPVFPAEEASSSSSAPVFPSELSQEDARSNLFAHEEWIDMLVGHALIEERIHQKEKILKFLKDEAVSLEDKMLCCQEDFGIIPVVGGYSPQGIHEGIERYCNYISALMHTYGLAQKYAQQILNSNNRSEKNQSQNTLYYLLSFEARHFREFIEVHYSHSIPEHSLEDSFYEMISLKMCKAATKENDVLNEYIVASFTEAGVRKQIDNKRLLAFYQKQHEALIKEFNINNPIFWLGSVEIQNKKQKEKIEKIVEVQLNLISKQLAECGQETLKITNSLAERLSSYNSTYLLDKDSDVVQLYHICGPWVLEAIQSYEAVTEKIEKIEKDSVQWLKKFKVTEKSALPMKARTAIDGYLTLQEKKEKDRIALERKKAQEDAERIKREKAAARQARQQQAAKEERQKIDIAAQGESVSKIREEKKEKYKAPKIEQEATAKILPDIGASSSFGVEQPAAENRQAIISSSEADSQPQKPKVKVKTRPENPVPPIAREKLEKEEIKSQEFSLPEKYKTEEFTSFVESLWVEKNDRKLKQAFKELSSSYGIFVENPEKNNKGYFAVQSPLTGKIHVASYHHLHANNPYASIFMALRDVLVAAGLRE